MKLRKHEPKIPRRQRSADLVLPEAQESELKFDPRRDVPNLNKVLWREDAENQADENNKAERLYQYAMLFPDEPLAADPALWRDRTASNVLFIMWLLKYEASVVHNWLKTIANEDMLNRGHLDNLILFREVILIRLLFPELEEKKRAAVEQAWSLAKTWLEDARQTNNLLMMCSIASWARLAFPNRFSELGFTPQDLRHIRQEAERLWAMERESNWFSGGLRPAFGLAVLSADDVRVTEKGIELINQTRLGHGAAPLPDRATL